MKFNWKGKSLDRNLFLLFRLLPNQAYRARIRYITDNDRSLFSDPSEWIKTLEIEPENAPQDLSVCSSRILLFYFLFSGQTFRVIIYSIRMESFRSAQMEFRSYWISSFIQNLSVQ